MKKILAINIEKTLTQIGVYFNEEAIIFDEIDHSPEELFIFEKNIEQLPFRYEITTKLLRKYNLTLHEFDGIVGFGGLLSEKEGGIYRVNSILIEQAQENVEKDITSLTPLLLEKLENEFQLETFIVEHKQVDELPALSRFSANPIFFRYPYFDALTIRTGGYFWEKEKGKKFRESNLIISKINDVEIETAAFLKGHLIDIYSSKGDGTFSIEESGKISAHLHNEENFSLNDYLKNAGIRFYFPSQKITLEKIDNFLISEDEKENYTAKAFIYNYCKDIAALSLNFKGKLDSIIIIGLNSYPNLKVEIENWLNHIGEIYFQQNFSPIKALSFRLFLGLENKEEIQEFI